MKLKESLKRYFDETFIYDSYYDDNFVEYISYLGNNFTLKGINYLSVDADNPLNVLYYDFTRFCKNISHIELTSNLVENNVHFYRSSFKTEKEWLMFISEYDVILENNNSVLGEGHFRRGMIVSVDSNPKTKYSTTIEKIIARATPISDFNKHEYLIALRKKYAMFIIKTSDLEFKIVSGEEIRYWYLEDNYYDCSHALGSSCMRSSDCQEFFEIYVQNPEIVEMAILLCDDKLVARQLIWEKRFVDKIYSCHPKFENGIMEYSQKYVYDNNNDPIDIYAERVDTDYESIYTIQLNKYNFETYPFIDSFCFMTNEGLLHCNINRDIDKVFGYTNGTSKKGPTSYHCSSLFEDLERVLCHHSDEYYDFEDTFTCNYDGYTYHDRYIFVLRDEVYYEGNICFDYKNNPQVIGDCEFINHVYVRFCDLETYKYTIQLNKYNFETYKESLELELA